MLERLTKAFAKLRFKDLADIEEANDAIRLYKYVASQYDIFDNPYTVPKNPQHVAADVCAGILQENPFVDKRVDDLIITACSKNPQVAAYFSGEKKIKTSYKARAIRDILIQNQNIKQVGSNPVTLQWFEKQEQNHKQQPSSNVILSSTSNTPSLLITPKDQNQNNIASFNSKDKSQQYGDSKNNLDDESDEGNVCNLGLKQNSENKSLTNNMIDNLVSTFDKTITSPSSPSSPSNIHNDRTGNIPISINILNNLPL